MRQDVLLVALSALTVATAQTQNFTIDPNSVNPSLRADWCNAEYNTCRVLCANNPTENDCNADTLKYVCTCQNGSAPGLQYYTQTMPTFICETAFSNCIAANTGSSKAQDECKANIKSKCGTLDPTKAQINNPSDQSTSSAGPAGSSGATHAPTAAQNNPATSTSHGAAAATNAALIGNGAAMVVAGVFAALL
ncbi:hypothetical protein VTI74DRAFT_3963 [Chaetomium olivicolor]